MGYTLLLSARLQFDEQLVSIKRRVAVKVFVWGATLTVWY